ncbi:exosome complex subunit Rrp46 [Colletotrichum limetticola]|uniref:Exosome complex subunit Rrp46 n=1 Tax=Colletotrichum limetticola TaxID=1209924 RepID=A0ABQ9PAX2_9PEZI|nr:exosome complex subunit Rrp46 [Colletotrichum limetticola]
MARQRFQEAAIAWLRPSMGRLRSNDATKTPSNQSLMLSYDLLQGSEVRLSFFWHLVVNFAHTRDDYLGTGERQLENILRSALRQLIPVKNFPRCLIQVTLQVTETPQNDYANSKVVQAQSSLPLLPALFHSAILALLSAAVPLKAIATCATLAVVRKGDKIIADPSPLEIDQSKSLHVVIFTSQNDLLLLESEGTFSMAEWDEVINKGQSVCSQHRQAELGVAMDDDSQDATDMQQFIRTVMESKAA